MVIDRPKRRGESELVNRCALPRVVRDDACDLGDPWRSGDVARTRLWQLPGDAPVATSPEPVLLRSAKSPPAPRSTTRGTISAL